MTARTDFRSNVPGRPPRIGEPVTALRFAAALILVAGLAALAVMAAGPAPRTTEGAEQAPAPRVIEEWRGNSAGFTPID